MKQLHDIHKALNKATQETTHYMTAQVQSEARASGWPDEVVDSLHVTHDSGEFNYRVAEEHHATALNYEYGTPGRQPTAAIRRTSNQKNGAEEFLLGRLSTHIGDL